MTIRTPAAGRLLAKLVLITAALTSLGSTCTNLNLNDALGTDCTPYVNEYQTALDSGGTLLQSVSTSADSYPMALVLNARALNDLFSNLADTDLPELSESATVLGQRLGVSVRPTLPTLQIGGQGGCPDCFQGRVPFDVGLDLAGFDLPRGTGAISVQMPIRLIPRSDRQTELVAQFQSLEVLGMEMDFGNDLAGNIFDIVEPIASTLLTQFLQSRFEDQPIVTLDSWEIGRGEVLLAGRGPFVFPETGTVMIAMQSNLPVQGASIAAQSALPAGADIGVVFHPGLLSSMGRRMIYEDVIPQSYNGQGQTDPGGDVHLTLASVGSSDDGLLRTTSTLWQTGGYCGAADLSASVGFSANTQGISFAIRDVEVSNGRGSYALLELADSVAGGYLDALVQTLDTTVNYDQILGGEAFQEAAFDTFELNIDGRGISLFLGMP